MSGSQILSSHGKARKPPFVPFRISRGWGNNSAKHKQDDTDILALDRTGNRAICCECKFRNELFDMQEYRNFMDTCASFGHVEERYYYLFVKSGYTKDVQEMTVEDGMKMLIIEDLFRLSHVSAK